MASVFIFLSHLESNIAKERVEVESVDQYGEFDKIII